MKEIIDTLRLEVYGYGFVAEPGNVVRGFIEMEMPGAGAFPSGIREKFYSADTTTRYEAMEDVCGIAISELCGKYHVVVKDANFDEVGRQRYRASEAETWTNLLKGVVDNREEENKTIRTGFAALFCEAKQLCRKFADVFPVCLASTSRQPENAELRYGGSIPPMARMEQFAFMLIDLINRGTAASMVGPKVVSC